jgi:glycosyltransferase involved in cell wall biosynthesis
MNICILAHSSDLSGANQALLETIEVLCEKHELFIILPSEGPLMEEIHHISNSINVKVIRFNWWVYREKKTFQFQIIKNIIRNLIAIISILKIHKKQRFDYFISNTITISIGCYLSKITQKKHFWYFHEFGFLDHNLKFFIGKKAACLLIKISRAKIVVNSKIMQMYFNDWLGINTILLFNSMHRFTEKIKNHSINPPESFGITKLIIYGRIDKSKGQHIILSALKKCIDLGYIFELTILGSYDDKRYFSELTDFVLKSNMDRYVKFEQHVHEPINLISNHHIVINCSKSEAFGRTMIEAMYLKKLVIATTLGSGPELIGNNERGLLFNRDANQLFEVLRDIHLNNPKVPELIDNGFSFASENFNKINHSKQLDLILC